MRWAHWRFQLCPTPLSLHSTDPNVFIHWGSFRVRQGEVLDSEDGMLRSQE